VAPYSGQLQVSKLAPQMWLVIDASGVFDICAVRSRGDGADAPGLQRSRLTKAASHRSGFQF